MTSDAPRDATPSNLHHMLQYWKLRCEELENENEELRFKLASFGIYIKPKPRR